MFNRILIANRGEIACRIMKTCQKMGIHTIAVYSDVDIDAKHVKAADSAFYIGKSPSLDSYLNIKAVIEAAILSKAEAIHPGYGFLSENADFAHACSKANIVFIGPSTHAMEIMGSKQLAKQLLEQTNVPLIPGYHGLHQSNQTLQQKAVEIGFPVLLKAAKGGGGKGMRIVQNIEAFEEAIQSARREASASFGDETMLIEKYVAHPRHVEVQIIADKQGNTYHLFDRDCSIQRRHQKIVEEAPAPFLADSLREKLFAASISVAKAVGYEGVGTVEFLVDGDDFYFMEMNTRLQVEHPVTEMITGLDLVASQIDIASGKALPFIQSNINESGHAIELRIYAEDSTKQFIPSIGKISTLSLPEGEGIRVDSGVEENSMVSPYYDAMIAKLIAHGTNREEALQRLIRALTTLRIGGIKTNIPFLKTICKNNNFSKGKIHTAFLEVEQLISPAINETLPVFMAAVYDYEIVYQKLKEDPLSLQTFAWQSHLNTTWQWTYFSAEKQYQFLIEPLSANSLSLHCTNESFSKTHPNQPLQLHFYRDECYLYLEDDNKQLHRAYIQTKDKDNLIIYLPSGNFEVSRFNWQNQSAASSNKGQLLAPMPATIVSILKQEGEAVKAGDPLVILEAMKMEHTISAPEAGILKTLYYELGDQVAEGSELLILETGTTTT